MGQEALTHSDRYVRKTNRIILIVGIITLCVFLFGLMLLGASDEEEEQHYEIERSIDAETNLNLNNDVSNETEIEFAENDEGARPITTKPNPINMGKVVVGKTASNVLTIGTDGKKAIRIISVELEDAPFEGFTYESTCKGAELRGKLTCLVTMEWRPTVAANVQNNFKIIWHETNVSESNAKHDEVPVYGSAVTKDECSFCNGAAQATKDVKNNNISAGKNVRTAIGPDGKPIGIIGEDGIVRDFNGNEIGIVKNGMILDENGNVIGVAATGRMILDENGNVVGYVDENGVAHDKDGNVTGRMLADGTVVDENGKVIGKAVDYGYVYDDNGNIIGQVLADGTVIDENGNAIGHVDENGNVVDMNGKILGKVAKAGEVVFDENGKAIGVVMPNGMVVDENGNVIGKINDDGSVVAKQKIGKRGATARLAVDENGNEIGYIDENGNVIGFNGEVIGHVDEDGNIVDKNGKIVGKASDQWRDLALDENGNVIGFIDEDGIVHGQDGKIVGYVDANGNIIGDVLPKSDKINRLALDKDGNVIGYVDENGNIIDENGEIVGRVDENGNAVDNDGNVIGVVANVDKDGNVLDKNGEIIGHVDENGNVVDKNGRIIGNAAISSGMLETANAPIIGKAEDTMHLALDENGNVIGYIDENGNVFDKNGNAIGKVDDAGNIIDSNGNIIGRRGKAVKVAKDANGNIIGFVDDKGIVRSMNNEIIGKTDSIGNVRAFGLKVIGNLLNKDLLPITPAGKVLGKINNRGEVIKQQKVVGKMRPNGLVTDVSGAKIIAKGVTPGSIVSFGCDYRYTLDKDGIIRQNEEVTDNRVYADGTVWTADERFLGKVVELGSVYDNRCNYLGEVSADGYVRDAKNREIGCLNPDGTVLDLKEPKIKGHLVKPAVVISNKSSLPLGTISPSGVLYNKSGAAVACMNNFGDMYDKDNVYVGKAVRLKYVYSFSGKPLGTFDNNANMKLANFSGAYLILDNLVAALGQRIIGYALPEINVLYDSENKKVGHLFPDGNIYDKNGALVDRFNGGQEGIYSNTAARFIYPKPVVDVDGINIGQMSYDLNIYAGKGGNPIGRANAKGQIFDDVGHLIGGVVQRGGVRSYTGLYLGSVVSGGEVVQLEKVSDVDGKNYVPGEITGNVIPDGHVVKNNQIIGEVLPSNIMVDVFGNFAGISNDYGQVLDLSGRIVADLLPGGGNNYNYVARKSGIVVNFAGSVIGTALPDGTFMDAKHVVSGKVLADGKVLSTDGKFIGEVVSGDIVIGNDDKFKGIVGFDGKIYNQGIEIGHILTDGLASDKQNNIIGRVYTIGNAILSNKGEYIGRLSGNGRVIGHNNAEIGYLKSNGSFVDLDKNVAGYSLPEVARNRRN